MKQLEMGLGVEASSLGGLDLCEDGEECVFMPKPFAEYSGHKADLLDISWSKNYFLLSASMDKTVRLWHVSRIECLCIFQVCVTSSFRPSLAIFIRQNRGIRGWKQQQQQLQRECNALGIPRYDTVAGATAGIKSKMCEAE